MLKSLFIEIQEKFISVEKFIITAKVQKNQKQTVVNHATLINFNSQRHLTLK